MTLDLTAVDAVLAAGWVPAAQAILTVIVSTVGSRLALNWIGSAMRRARVDLGTQILVKRGLLVAWLVVTLLVVLGIVGVNPTGLVAVAGAGGCAFSLANQDILQKFFNGVYPLL